MFGFFLWIRQYLRTANGNCLINNNSVFANFSLVLSVISGIIFLITMFYLYRLYMRSKLTALDLLISVLLIFIIVNKVFSPQFLLWISPLIAIRFGFKLPMFGFWLLISLLTSFIYPFAYGDTLFFKFNPNSHLFYLIILLRNIVIIFFTIVIIKNVWRVRDIPVFYPRTINDRITE